METSSVAITDAASVHCFDQLSNIDSLCDLKQFMQLKK